MNELRLGTVPQLLQPAKVEKLEKTRERLAVEYDDARQELRAADLAVPAAVDADLEDEAAALIAGKPLNDPGHREIAARAKLDGAKRRAEAALLALNTVTREEAELIVETGAKWLDALDAEEAKASDELKAALAGVRQSLARLSEVRGNIAWLQRADSLSTLLRGAIGATAPQLSVPERLSDQNGRPAAVSLIMALEQLADAHPEPPRESRRLPGLPEMAGTRRVSRAAQK